MRDRKEDIPLLAEHFLGLFAQEMGIDSPALTRGALVALSEHSYPGNIRELKNVVERALIESRGGDIEPLHLRLLEAAESTDPKRLSLTDLPLRYRAAELVVVKRAIDRAGGNMSAAARLLEIDRAKVYRILKAGRESD